MMYKAVIAPASGIAFVPSGSTTPIVLHPPKAAAGGATSVRYGNLTVTTRPGAEDWVPGPEWLARAGAFVPPHTEVVFARRKEGPKTYGWRAVAERPNGRKGTRILVLVDETETRDSVKWLLLHEFAHALVTATPTLAETLRAEKRPDGYPQNDDAHEAVFEEEVANAFADRLAPVPGLDRRWWRERTRRYVTPTIYGGVEPERSTAPWLPLVLLAGVGYLLFFRGTR
jgi:hypothetical protein